MKEWRGWRGWGEVVGWGAKVGGVGGVTGWGIVFELLFMVEYFLVIQCGRNLGYSVHTGRDLAKRTGESDGSCVGRRAILCQATGAGVSGEGSVCRWCSALRPIGR